MKPLLTTKLVQVWKSDSRELHIKFDKVKYTFTGSYEVYTFKIKHRFILREKGRAKLMKIEAKKE